MENKVFQERIVEVEEHRKQKRQLLRYYLWVFNKKDNSLIGHVGDITTEGVMLVSKKLIEVGEKINLEWNPLDLK